MAGRAIGEAMSKLLKVPVMAVNKPGAGGTLITDSAIKAGKDGYTILIINNASLVFNRILTPETVPYDPFKDLIAPGHGYFPRTIDIYERSIKSSRVNFFLIRPVRSSSSITIGMAFSAIWPLSGNESRYSS